MSVHLGASAAESCVNACSEFISELRGLFASSRYSGHSQNDDSFDTARQLGAVYALFAEEDLRTLLSGFVDQAKAMSMLFAAAGGLIETQDEAVGWAPGKAAAEPEWTSGL